MPDIHAGLVEPPGIQLYPIPSKHLEKFCVKKDKDMRCLLGIERRSWSSSTHSTTFTYVACYELLEAQTRHQ
jgi:hypothetical protein